MSLLTRLLNLFRARSLDRDLDDEVRFHLSERIASNLRQGMTYGMLNSLRSSSSGALNAPNRE